MLLGRLLGRFGISFRGRKDGVAGGGCNKSFLDRLPPSCLDFQRAVVEPLHDLKRPGVRAAKAPGPQQWRTCPGSRARKPDDAASPRCWATSRRGIPGIPAQSPLGRSGQRQRDLRVRLGHAAGAVDVEVMVLSATHSRRQLETIAQQSREIASAAQKLATETTRPPGFGIHQPDELTRRPSSLRTSCGLLRRPVLTVRQRRRAWC